MAQKFRVRGLGEVGVIKDVPPYELPPNAWSDAFNVRFKRTHIEKMSGYLPAYTATKPDGTPLLSLEITDSKKKLIAYPDSIYSLIGTSYTKINGLNASGSGELAYQASFQNPWYSTILSNCVVFNNLHDNPQGLLPLSDRLVTLPKWGIGTRNQDGTDGTAVDWKCHKIRAYKQYLIALNMIENAVEMPQRVRWSDVAYINQLPTNWYENYESSDGGFNDLTDCESGIQEGLPLRDTFMIYTNKETYMMNYVGGVDVFSFSKLFSDSGVLAPSCVVGFEGKHFVISQSDIFVHNGSDKTPVASNRVKQYLIDEISRVNPSATRLVAMPTQKEIWVCYVGTGGDTSAGLDLDRACNRAAVWNWEFDTWSFYDLPNVYDISVMTAPSTDTVEWSSFTDTDAWDHSHADAQKAWRNAGSDFARQAIYTCSQDKCLYVLDLGSYVSRWDDTTKSTKSTPVVCYVERSAMDLDEVVEDTLRYKLITQVTPQINGTGNLTLNIGGAHDPNLTPKYSEFYNYDIQNDVKYDTLANYRYPAIRFTDNGAGNWRFTGYDIDITEGGTR